MNRRELLARSLFGFAPPVGERKRGATPLYQILCCVLAAASSLGQSNAGGVVSTCDEAALRSALVGGGTVTFACDGTIALANTIHITEDTTLDASGHTISLSGQDTVRILQTAPGVSLTLAGLRFVRGRSALGAALYNDGATVNAIGCAFSENQARGADATTPAPGESAAGGAVYNTGTLQLKGCVLATNVARGGAGFSDVSTSGDGTSGGCASGGAVFSSGILRMADCVVNGNRAVGGHGGEGDHTWDVGYGGGGGDGCGGAVAGRNLMVFTNCVFRGNSCQGGAGGWGYLGGGGGNAAGGALHSDVGTVVSDGCWFQENSITAGGGHSKEAVSGTTRGGAVNIGSGTAILTKTRLCSNYVSGEAAEGGGLAQASGSLEMVGCSVCRNRVDGWTATTYYGRLPSPCAGGGISTKARTAISHTTISSNQVSGSSSGGGYSPVAGGMALGGGILARGSVDMRCCAIHGNGVVAGRGALPFFPGPGTAGGNSMGGGVASDQGTNRFENCTFTGNQVTGGPGPEDPYVPFSGPGGDAFGGALYCVGGSNQVLHCTIVTNSAVGGTGEGPGVGYAGGVYSTGDLGLQNSIVAGNALGGDLSGTFTGDHNLIGVDPLLESLGFNGGATWTMALLSGSPAINAGSNLPSLLTDQRGVARPYGASPDIGAYEWDGPAPSDFVLQTPELTDSSWQITGRGPAQTAFHLQTSVNLSAWEDGPTNCTGTSGWFQMRIACSAESAGFFRLVCP